eukprot:TRINITY_DN72482_c0_g1_i1.p1 TRINITY_DN72482_c0_g1~~TRINITY_DN72482_c0_g1_i1.p1  ORF type:complete len:264 (-),score=46.01 TRINITY_DN72482_c0_g1_i1:52-843(-)
MQASQCEQVACYGALDNYGIDSTRDKADTLVNMNPRFRDELQWHAWIWKRGRSRYHWVVVLFAATEVGQEEKLRVPADLLAEGDVYGPAEEVPWKQLFLTFELVTARDAKVFSLLFKSFPEFRTDRPNVYDLGLCGPLKLADVIEYAIAVIGTFRRYGMVGANCQHFAKDFLAKLGDTVGGNADSLASEDQRAAQYTRRSIGAAYVVGGGVRAGLKAVAGCTMGAVASHIVLGIALASAGMSAVQLGYKAIKKHHRRSASSGH